MHGFLGPNGAGKSTTIRVLLGLLRADAGTVAAARRRPVARRRRRCTAGSPTCPATSTLWPNLTGGEVDRPARPAARRARPAAPAHDLLERFELDPTKKAPRLLQGQPAEGRAGRRARLRRRAAAARRADLGPRPADGGGVPATCIDEERRARAARCCCPATSSPRSRRCATGSRIIRDGRTVETGTLAELRHLTRTSIEAELAGAAPTGLARLPGVHDLDVDGHRVALRRRHRRARRPARPAQPALGVAQPDEPPADARGAVPAALRGRRVVTQRPRRRHRRCSSGCRCAATGSCCRSGWSSSRSVAASSAAATVGLYPTAAAPARGRRGGQRRAGPGRAVRPDLRPVQPRRARHASS